ncbi:hypothetical protein G6F31_019514 [Rhizopus arrhizus]|nr:hypothetical protein G6F31_019514 [Rhizopus arrhizus]
MHAAHAAWRADPGIPAVLFAASWRRPRAHRPVLGGAAGRRHRAAEPGFRNRDQLRRPVVQSGTAADRYGQPGADLQQSRPAQPAGVRRGRRRPDHRGRQPGQGDQPAAQADQAAAIPPRPQRTVAPDLAPVVEPAVAHCQRASGTEGDAAPV